MYVQGTKRARSAVKREMLMNTGSAVNEANILPRPGERVSNQKHLTSSHLHFRRYGGGRWILQSRYTNACIHFVRGWLDVYTVGMLDANVRPHTRDYATITLDRWKEWCLPSGAHTIPLTNASRTSQHGHVVDMDGKSKTHDRVFWQAIFTSNRRADEFALL